MGKARKRIADIKKQNEAELQKYEEMTEGLSEAALLGIGSAKTDRELVETAWLQERSKTYRGSSHSVQEDEYVVVNPRDLY
jgi:hypothetical protein